MDREELNAETAKIYWKEVETFFANGTVIYVSSELDLIDVALDICLDNKLKVQQWMSGNLINKVSDQQALEWLSGDTVLWSVVVKPWVLVQPIKDSSL
ncbi:MAG: DUF2288 domain-containing protein [Porticoccus sp.]|jgi:hypothetical protein|uniref:DUF2288 domain-containing protein n=1 Tax=Porticoccus sp. Uisw_050_02 TaxID=3230978 RepID=UPI0030AD0869|tara:strand:- start:3149 stop:3442 length:294 start_codon:yes stop_codon:yes gene_type:complete